MKESIFKHLGLSPVLIAFIVGLIVASCYTVLWTLQDEEEEANLQKADLSYAQATHSQVHPRISEKGRKSETGEEHGISDSE